MVSRIVLSMESWYHESEPGGSWPYRPALTATPTPLKGTGIMADCQTTTPPPAAPKAPADELHGHLQGTLRLSHVDQVRALSVVCRRLFPVPWPSRKGGAR